jgi:hypothetical protein
MSYFDAIYVINLPSRSDRRDQMKEQFRKIGMDPGLAPVVFFDAVRPDDAGGFPTVGTRGCFLSHLGVLRAARAAGHQRILVLEDDVNFSGNFVERFASLTPAIDALGWDFWYLGALSVTPPVSDAGTSALVTLPSQSAVLGAHMFAVTSAVVAELVPYLEAMLARPAGDPAGGPMHVDGAYGWFRRDHPSVRTVVTTQPLGYQRPSRTDIHQLKWFDRLPVIKAVVGLLRLRRARISSRS